MGFSSKPSIKRTKPSNVFGHIPGVPVGSTFENRLFLHHSSVHSGILAGIAGSKHEGCYSVVLSGGYEDDKDEGYKFTYTGCGGRDRKNGEKPREGPQTCDQSWDNSRNMSLKVSAYTKKPVRVVRGYNSSSDFAPAQGYRYDGLYVVENAWMDIGKSGFKVCKFTLKRLPNQPPIPRRQGTLNLDLAEWERPKHFGSDSARTSSSRSPSPERSPQRHASRKGKEKAVPRNQSERPFIRRPKDESEEDDLEVAYYRRPDSPRRSGPSQTYTTRPANPPSKPPNVRLPPPAAIPPTTNISRAARKPFAAAQAQTPAPATATATAPQPDVFALLAEWSGSASKQATGGSSGPSAQKSTPATPRPCPTRTGTSIATRPPLGHPLALGHAPRDGAPSSNVGNLGGRRPRASESGAEDDAAREVKRLKLSASSAPPTGTGKLVSESGHEHAKVGDVSDSMDLGELEYP